MRSIKEILAFAFSRPEPKLSTAPVPPSPDELAVTFAAALMASGRYEDPAVAIATAWAKLPEFYISRYKYPSEIAPMFFVAASNDAAEAGEFQFAV